MKILNNSPLNSEKFQQITLKKEQEQEQEQVKVSVPAIELVSGGMFVVMYATLKSDPVLATFDMSLVLA